MKFVRRSKEGFFLLGEKKWVVTFIRPVREIGTYIRVLTYIHEYVLFR